MFYLVKINELAVPAGCPVNEPGGEPEFLEGVGRKNEPLSLLRLDQLAADFAGLADELFDLFAFAPPDGALQAG